MIIEDRIEYCTNCIFYGICTHMDWAEIRERIDSGEIDSPIACPDHDIYNRPAESVYFFLRRSAQSNMTTEQAVKHLVSELRKDREPGSYYYSWQSNIAMSIYDTFPQMDNKHDLCNEAAKRFLELLIRDSAEGD